jgi:hypothetical protein
MSFSRWIRFLSSLPVTRPVLVYWNKLYLIGPVYKSIDELVHWSVTKLCEDCICGPGTISHPPIWGSTFFFFEKIWGSTWDKSDNVSELCIINHQSSFSTPHIFFLSDSIILFPPSYYICWVRVWKKNAIIILLLF